jgi:ABC-type Mn2+/Zn2+ transport system permease subunit
MMAFQEILITFPYALAAGLIIAIACSFLGNLVVLRRLVFIGATLSETAACGIAAAFFFGFNPILGAIAFNLMVVTVLAFSTEEKRVPRDAVLAAIFILSTSLGILFVSKSAVGLDEVKSLLFGDILITTAEDFKILTLTLLPITALILIFGRPIVYTFVDRDEAKILGIKVRFWELFFYYALGLAASLASKLGGMLLVFFYLVIPPVAGLLAGNRLWTAGLISCGIAVLSTLAGFYFSYVYDLPTNPVIAATGCSLLALIWTLKSLFRRQ